MAWIESHPVWFVCGVLYVIYLIERVLDIWESKHGFD